MTSDATQSSVASSSNTLWAQASKEWVIPAKPKPGRKPKKDAAAPKEANEVDSKGRRVQNRAAQRAFRERKQSQLAELQARVLSYEQGEIERNVALQKISKRLKEENEQLKAENASLKDEIARLKDHVTTFSASASATLAQRDQDVTVKSLKRWRDESVCSILSDDVNAVLESTSHKRPRAETISPAPSTTPASQYAHEVVYVPSPPSVVSSPGSNGISRSPFSPLPFAPMPAPSGSSRMTGPQSASAMFCPPSGDSLKTFDAVGNAPPFDTFDCGLCTENTPCVCREIAMQTGITTALSGYGNDRIETQNSIMDVLKVEDTEKNVASSAPSVIEIPSASDEIDSYSNLGARPSKGSSSSLQHDMMLGQQANSTAPFQIRLPSPEPVVASNAPGPSRSVPLRLKRAQRSTSNKIWQINPIAPTCSGDPSNCPACKDDDFGKAFCRALGDSASTTAPACASCPNPEACGKTPRSAYASGSGRALKQDSESGNNFKTIELTPMDSTQGAPILHSSSTDAERPSAKALSSSKFSGSASPPISQALPSATDGKTPKRSETIPANEAWARLKSHPNIAFADLSMLADVVARRTKCSGPVAVIHPAPGSITPERDAARSPALPELESESATAITLETEQSRRREDSAIVLTDPHAHFRTQEHQRAHLTSASSSSDCVSSSVPPTHKVSSAASLGPGATGRPALVPQEELRECGRRRIREVDAAGVREALRILDAQFGKHS